MVWFDGDLIIDEGSERTKTNKKLKFKRITLIKKLTKIRNFYYPVGPLITRKSYM